ncbi:MAG TPA: AtpZ/AtpI family protein [Flavobacteriia bacterium]|jgi:hypothetical protein|nr:AtpZ/AtpI family protein [Flavobacteriia bacterium]
MAKKPIKQPNKLLFFSSLGLEMGITIYLSAKVGNWLDYKYPNNNKYFTLTLVLIAFVVSMFLLIKKLKKIQD